VFGLSFFFPLCRDALAGPKRLLKGWDVLQPTQRRPPLPFSVVQLLAARWAAEGRRDLAIAALLGFECYFRPSELCGVLLSDITWDRSVRNDKIFIGAIALRQTKTGANMEVDPPPG
jgi:integrase